MSARALAWTLRVVLAVPFIVALVALTTSRWWPTLDLAMTELRVRDVFGRHSPLIGLPGRIGDFPEQGSHPGPISFYLLMPVYRLLGSTAYALLVGTAVINVGAAWTAIWIAGRRGGPRLMMGVAALLMVLMAWFGASVLTQPWNPYLPLVSFVVVLLSAWAVLDGDHRLLSLLVVASTFCAQTHVPYLTLCLALCLVSFGVVIAQWWLAHADDRTRVWSVVIAVATGFVLWLPVLIDEFRHTPGNITMLRRHFLSPPEAPVGFQVGAKTVLAHFDVVHIVSAMPNFDNNAITHLDDLGGGRWQIGAVVLLTWLTAAAVSSRLPDRRIARLHVVVAVGSFVAFTSASRIFGKVWFYLSLWSWTIALAAVGATLWTLIVCWEQSERPRLPVQSLSIAAVAIAGGLFVADAATVDPPEHRLSWVLGELVGPTVEALNAGVGAADGGAGVYVVIWDDAYHIGSQGYGMISELEREGFTARTYPTFRVPVTHHRVADPSEATAEVALVTGVNVADWRSRPGVVEVAHIEPRTPAELAEFTQLREEVLDILLARELGDVAALIDTNLMGARLDPRLGSDLESKLVRMLVLGQETSVFIAPPGSY